MEIINKKTDKILLFIILSIMVIAYGLLSFFTPPQIDDLSFMGNYLDYSSSRDFRWNALMSFAHDMWLYDNARFANLWAPIVNLFSPWKYIFPWATGLMMALILWFSMKIIGIRENKSVLAALLWGAIVLFLPWRNCIFVADYSLNYIYTGAITLGFIYFLIGRSSLLRNVWIFLGMLIWAFFAGGWHEGFSVPTLAGIAMLILVRICQKSNQKRGWRWYVVIGVYLAVAIYVTFCPGVLSRTFREVSSGKILVTPFKMFVDFLPTIIFVVILALTPVVGKWRIAFKDALKNDMFVVVATAAIAGAVISLAVEHTPRTSFYPNLTAITAAVMLLCAPIVRLLETRWVKWVALLTALLCVAHAAHSIRWQYRFDKEYDEIMTQFVDEGKTTVYYDIIMPEEVDIFTLYFPSKSSWVIGFHFFSLGLYLDYNTPAVVPTALRDVTMQSGEPLNSGAEEFQIRRVEDALFTRKIPKLNMMIPVTVDVKMNGSGEIKSVEGMALNFVTERGDSLAYIKPYKIDNRQIKEIHLTEYSTRPLPL